MSLMATAALNKMGVSIAAATFILVAAATYRDWKVRHDANEPPFCTLCGISSHAPKEQTRQACPRNTDGRGHNWDGVGA